jgi:hypothetical protein
MFHYFFGKKLGKKGATTLGIMTLDILTLGIITLR